MSNENKYSLVWLPCGEENQLAEKFYVPNYRQSLPFLVEKQLPKHKFSISEKNLLWGILVGLYDIQSTNNDGINTDKPTLLYLLDVLGNGFSFKSPEKMILDVAYNFGQEKEFFLNRKVLKVGTMLIKDSSKIKSDLILVDWEILAKDSNNEILDETLSLFYDIDLKNLIEGAKEFICYYGFCAMVLLNKKEQEIEEFLETYVYPNVKLTKLKINIKNLLENQHTTTTKDLLIDIQ
jgi:hypothetical protein